MIISNGRLKSINKYFQTGMIAVISDFNVVPNDHHPKFTNHAYIIKFHGETKARRSKRFKLESNSTSFQLTKISDILGLRLDRDLPVG